MESTSCSMDTKERPHGEELGDNNGQQEQEPITALSSLENLNLDIRCDDSDSDSDSDKDDESDELLDPDLIMTEEPPKLILRKPRSYYEILPGVMEAEHPGCTVSESPSINPDQTTTSPECCRWLQTREIDREMFEITSQVCFRGATSLDMLRIAACLLNADKRRHLYRVREDVGFAFPPGATGTLRVKRHEVRKPQPPTGQRKPPAPPSPLRQVWSAGDLLDARDEEAAAANYMDANVGELDMSAILHRKLVAAILDQFPDSGYHSPEMPAQKKTGDDGNEDGTDQSPQLDIDMDPARQAHMMALLSSINHSFDDDDDDDSGPVFPGPF